MTNVCLVTLACYGQIKYNFWQSHQVPAIQNIKIIEKKSIAFGETKETTRQFE